MKISGHILAVRAALLLLAVLGLLFCAIWYPFSVSLSGGMWWGHVPTREENIRMWTQLLFYWLSSVPCFVLLGILWRVSGTMRTETLFCEQNVRRLRTSCIILAADEGLFLAGNILFFVWGWNDFAIVYFAFAGGGLAVLAGLSVAARYLKKAAELQEEVAGTV